MVEDSIRIVVFDDAVGSLTQMTTHLATREGFEHKIIPFENNGTVWKIVPLNPILLADLDISSDPFAVMCAPPKPDKRTTVREVEQEVQKVRLISSHNEGGK